MMLRYAGTFIKLYVICIRNHLFPSLIFTTITSLSVAGESPKYSEADWGIGVTVRTATILYDTDDDSVSSFVPMLFYDGEYFFLNGIEGGVKAYTGEKIRLDLLGRLRFFDIPSSLQNEIQEDSLDVGARIRYFFSEQFASDFDILTDKDGRLQSNIRLSYLYENNDHDFTPYINLRLNSGDYNSHYYGLTLVDVDSGTEFSLGVLGKYHLWKNLYLIGRYQSTFLDDSIRDSQFIDKDISHEVYLGVGVFNEERNKRKTELSISPYLRLAHGWATPSNLGDIITGEGESDEYNNQLTSLFYGYPLADDLFGIPLAMYLTPGFVYHWSSEVQKDIPEFVLAIKAYYTFKWPFEWRFGFAEGLSYVTDIPYVENSEMERKGYEPSNLMNYLDFSLDIHLADILNSSALKGWYLGYSIHHRSSIFESASQFGRIKGGSNYNTVYLQYHF